MVINKIYDRIISDDFSGLKVNSKFKKHNLNLSISETDEMDDNSLYNKILSKATLLELV